MEFDKSRVFTALNADEIKVGSKGYFADNLRSLRGAAEEECSMAYGEIEEIMNNSYGCRFRKKDGDTYTLFYLAEEPLEKKFRPYKDTDEMVEDFMERFYLLPRVHSLPILWVKSNDRKYLITRLDNNAVTLCFEKNVFTFDLRMLAEKYTYLDGSPCGIEEDEE